MPSTQSKQSGSPSIREVAKAAGVSPSTVSRVLGAAEGTAAVNGKTRKAVLAVCRELNYSPNIHATRLFARRSNAIAFTIPGWDDDPNGFLYFSDPNLAMTLAGVSDAAAERDQQLVLMRINHKCLETRQHLGVLRDRSVDGMIVWGTRVADRQYIEEIAHEGWPLVLINGHIDSQHTIPGVQVDDRYGGALIGRHLIELGHRKLAYIAGPSLVRAAAERLEGFTHACAEAAITPIVRSGRFSFESGLALAGDLLDGPNPPTAIAAVSDLVAQGVLEAARRRNIDVPMALSVAGAEDSLPHSTPRLTTFRAPMAEMGRQAMEVVLAWIEALQRKGGQVPMATERILPVSLVVGNTTGSAMG